MSFLLAGASPMTFTDFGAHQHDCYEIILNTEGEGTGIIGDAEYPFYPGTIFVVPPETPHSKHSDKEFRDIYLHTDTLGPGLKQHSGPMVLNDDASATVEGIMKILLSRYLESSAPDTITETLYSVVLRYIGEHRKEEPSDPVVSEIIRVITASYSDPEFQITDALKSTGYSKDHIRRRFIKATGMAPVEYLKSIRLRCAKNLLTRRDVLHLPISEIARMSGFYDPAYFCRIFRQETGMAPSEFR